MGSKDTIKRQTFALLGRKLMLRCNRIRSCFIVAAFCLIALILTASSTIAHIAFTTTLTKTTKAELRSHAAYLAKILREQASDYEQTLLSYGSSTSTRITLIDAQGIVQFDSVYPAESLNNHLYRE